MVHYARLDKNGDAKQTLEEHLNGVANNVSAGFFNGINFPHFDSAIISEAVRYMGYFHDLGKYTKYFQDYLLNGKDSPYSDHAHISAIILYQNLWVKLGIKSFKDINNALAFFVYTCVGKHHGNLDMRNYCQKKYYESAMEKMQVQADNLLEKTKLIFEESSIRHYEDASFFKECCKLDNRWTDFKLHLMYQYITSHLKSDEWYFLLIYLFSLLIDGDKMDSAGAEKKRVELLPSTAVEQYINSKDDGQKTINRKRSTARQQVKKKLQSMPYEEIMENRFYTLTAPTGLGKTLLSLECAIEIQQQIHKNEGYIPRIITAIPFINIIEDNSKVYREVLGEEANIIVHHRLADYSKHVTSVEETSVDRALLEVEAWEGDVVLTTFVQLFHSILTGRNRALKKLNKLAGSIVILDEVQAIPEEYMPLLGAVLIKISEYYGSRFILMTATQPRILQSGDKLLTENTADTHKAIELLPDHNSYFENLERTEFIPLLERELANEEFVELVLDKWKCTGSVLIILNTIKRSIDIFNALRKRLKGMIPEENIGYLSTNIIPIKRRAVIDMAKEKLKPIKEKGHTPPSYNPYIMVSTQTIEAGVNLDFSMAFRDLAPLESLVQSAGRVNRENMKEKHRPVYLVKLGNDSNLVYKMSDIKATTDFLKKYSSIKEHEYQILIDAYYESRVNRPLPDKSKDVWKKGIMNLDFEEVEEFELISNTRDIADVFIEIDDCAYKIADAYEEILLNKGSIDILKLRGVINEQYLAGITGKISFQERKALLGLIKAKMNNYIISIRHNRLSKNIPPKFSDRNGIKSDMLYVPGTQINYYYDAEIGFKDETGGAYIF